MFDRYNEPARLALFFARYAVTQLGGDTIEPEHLVLGVLEGVPQALQRFTHASPTALRDRLEAAVRTTSTVAPTVEIPFSAATIRVLEQTAVEADDLRKRTIRAEHILLAVLVKGAGAAMLALAEAGVRADAIRTYLRDLPDEGGDGSSVVDGTGKGLVARQWKGVASRERADAYVDHLRRETFPALKRLAGFVTATIMKRQVDDGIEFQIVTVWQSRRAIEAFAGHDISVAVVPPAAQALLLRYDREVVHYEIV